MATATEIVKSRLARAGIEVGGGRAGIQVSNDAFYVDILRRGTLAAGEDYVRGWWSSDDLEETLYRALRAMPARRPMWSLAAAWNRFKNAFLNRQRGAQARTVARLHYDQHSEIFAHILGRRRMYSCAYWRDAETLDAAQQRKLELISGKLGLQPGERVLDIGCGRGGAAEYMSSVHGCSVLGVTNSIEQARFAVERGHSAIVRIECLDYRELTPARFGCFDKIVSIGMFEHVGPRNYREYFQIARRLLKPDGLFCLQTIGSGQHDAVTEAWTTTYIFPNSFLPSARHITAATDGLFILEDWHNLRDHYVRTLRAWRDNLERYVATPEGQRLPAATVRLWRYYLNSFIAAFRCGFINQCWQIVFSPAGQSRMGPRETPRTAAALPTPSDFGSVKGK